MMIFLQENPTLAIRLGPLAESRLYKIAHPAIFCDLSFVCLIQIGLRITPSPNWISAPLFFLRAQNSWGRMEGTIQLPGGLYFISVWCSHANVEGICPASRRLFAACKRVQRRLRKGGPYRTGF